MIYQPEKKSSIGYIRILENESETLLQKIKFGFKCKFCMINTKIIGKDVIYELPIYKKNQNNLNLIKKLNLEIEKKNIDAIVLSEDTKLLLNDDDINVPILNGKYLMKNLVIDIVNKILQLRNQDMSFISIYVLVEKYNKENLDILYDLASKVKNINIITDNIREFRKFEEKVFNANGIAVSVANNRKKGMRRADIIVNLDFINDSVKKYNINRNAIIINCNREKIEISPSFSGIIINHIKIQKELEALEYFKINNIFNKFDIAELYESLIFSKCYDKIIQRKNKDNVILEDFIGSRGIINIKEIQCSKR